MNAHRFSDIGHRLLPYANPLGADRIDRLIDRLPLRRGHRVLDVGAGKGEFLKRLIRRRGVSAVALEIRPEIAPKPSRRLRVVVMDAKRFEPRERFDAAACIGATHALGGYRPTLAALKRWVRPGGYVVVGEGFWMKRPSPGYLKALNARSSEFSSHGGTIAAAERLGLVPWWCVTATADEWDDYEWTYSSSIEAHVADHPDDPDAEAMRRRIRAWRRARLTWGRDTLGFGLYVFRNF